MTTEEIKNKILDIVKEVYHYQGDTWIYNGKLDIKELTPVGYIARFGMNNVDKPIVISRGLGDVYKRQIVYQQTKIVVTYDG